MKNLYILLITLFVFTFSNAQIVDIPDANFKYELVNTICANLENNGAPNTDVDTNDDGEIQVSEAQAVYYLNLDKDSSTPNSEKIVSMEGIQSFTNINLLYFKYNLVTEIDLSQNLLLRDFRCVNNEMVDLDFTQNPNLKIIWCHNNQLTNIDVSQNINLESIQCQNNQLSTLDVSQCLNLERIFCHYNQILNLEVPPSLALIDITCFQNQLSELDVTLNLNLEYLQCNFNNLESLDVSQNLNLEELHCGENNLESLDLSQNINLEGFTCSDNQLEYLNLKNGTNTSLDYMVATNNPNLTCIQVDDVDFANNNPDWNKDDWAEYSEECELGIEDYNLINFTIYPNPVQDILNIESQQPIEAVKIYNLHGQLIKVDSFMNVDISQLNTGLYFVQVIIEGKTVTKKFIKN